MGIISTSLKVVSIAVSCLTETNLLAIVDLSLDIGTRFSGLSSLIEELVKMFSSWFSVSK